MNARDYLVSKGLAKPGRGRYSSAAKSALDDAIAGGTVFDDYPKGAKPAKSIKAAKSKPAKSKPAKSESVEVEDIPNIPQPFWPKTISFYATILPDVVKEKQVKVGRREVCMRCHSSLEWCACTYSVVHVQGSEYLVTRR